MEVTNYFPMPRTVDSMFALLDLTAASTDHNVLLQRLEHTASIKKKLHWNGLKHSYILSIHACNTAYIIFAMQLIPSYIYL